MKCEKCFKEFTSERYQNKEVAPGIFVGGVAMNTICDDCYSEEKDINVNNMTLRDWFAGQALPESMRKVTDYCDKEGYSEDWREGIASDAYKIADAMIKERENER